MIVLQGDSPSMFTILQQGYAHLRLLFNNEFIQILIFVFLNTAILKDHIFKFSGDMNLFFQLRTTLSY